MRRLSARPLRRLLEVLSALTAIGCCGDLGFRGLSGFGDFLADFGDFLAELSIDLSFSVSITISGIGAWADLPGFVDLGFHVDLSGVLEAQAKADPDRDGCDEDVRVIEAKSSGGSGTVHFVAWKGDKYSLDNGYCYLAWLDGGSVHLASGPCGDEDGALRCDVREGEKGSLACEACLPGGECRSCGLDEAIDECAPHTVPGYQEMQTEPTDTGEPLETSGGISDACVELVDALIAAANDCGIDASLDAAALCSGNWSNLQACIAAYSAAEIFGSGCSVLEGGASCEVVR